MSKGAEGDKRGETKGRDWGRDWGGSGVTGRSGVLFSVWMTERALTVFCSFTGGSCMGIGWSWSRRMASCTLPTSRRKKPPGTLLLKPFLRKSLAKKTQSPIVKRRSKLLHAGSMPLRMTMKGQGKASAFLPGATTWGKTRWKKHLRTASVAACASTMWCLVLT